MWENLFRCLVVSNFRLGAAINDIHLSDSVEVLKNRGSTAPFLLLKIIVARESRIEKNNQSLSKDWGSTGSPCTPCSIGLVSESFWKE